MSDALTVLYDHYKDTCSQITENVKRRDRLMLYVILILGFFALQALFPSISNVAVSDFLKFKFGLSLQLNLSVLGSLVWFLLLVFTLRYFQVAAFVERQYAYIHSVEDKLNKELGRDLIVREGKFYLNQYPIFSNWMSFLYTIVFPFLLLVSVVVKITSELISVYRTGWSMGLALNSVIFILLGVSIVLYLIMLHIKPKK